MPIQLRTAKISTVLQRLNQGSLTSFISQIVANAGTPGLAVHLDLHSLFKVSYVFPHKGFSGIGESS